jgi:integrase
VFKDRASAVSWDGHEARAERSARTSRRDGPTFGDVATEWWALVEAGTYARRRGRSRQLSDTTIADYRGALFGGTGGRDTKSAARSLALIHRCGRRPIAALDDSYWQSIIDELVRDGKSHSRIATYLAVIRHIYAYARRPNLRVVTSDPTRELEMPANDGKVRERVATADEAANLIEALPVSDSAGALSWESVTEIRASSQSAAELGRRFGVSDALVGKVSRGELYKTPDGRRSLETGDRAGWGLAFYTGMRRSAIGRAQWPHVFWEADEIMVAKSKSDAGEGRRVPMVGPLKKILREEWMRVGRPETGRIVKRSVLSGKWQARADRRLGASRARPRDAPRGPPHVRQLLDGGRLQPQADPGVPGACGPGDDRPLHQDSAGSARHHRAREAGHLPRRRDRSRRALKCGQEYGQDVSAADICRGSFGTRCTQALRPTSEVFQGFTRIS